MNNNLEKLNILKKIKPNAEWSILVKKEILKTPIDQSQNSLLQKNSFFAIIKNINFKIFATSVITASLVLVIGGYNQSSTPVLSNQTISEIEYVIETKKEINLAIKNEIDNNGISEKNKEVITLLVEKRDKEREKLKTIIDTEVSSNINNDKKDLSGENIELFLLVEKLNKEEQFSTAIVLLKKIEK